MSRDPEICGGELCANRTRIPVTAILDSLSEGASTETILTSYPSFRPEHVQASLASAGSAKRVGGRPLDKGIANLQEYRQVVSRVGRPAVTLLPLTGTCRA
ncbi:MAG: DUF433 domain-containing protein [Bryobacterales bacterium]|nr:DUF433 domain-containing protein [Bryobacterales bacterium]